jgi:type IV pilus assembly protein PilC
VNKITSNPITPLQAPKSLITYQWRGVDKQGQTKQGEIQAIHRVLAKQRLLSQGLIVHKITRKRGSLWFLATPRVTAYEISTFSRQMATLISAGIPIVQACDIASKTQNKRPCSQLIDAIKEDIETGLTFAESLRKHPSLFNDLYCNLVEAGESAGALDVLLESLACYLERLLQIKQKIKQALTYPLFVLTVALLITIAMLLFIVPQFEALYNNFGSQLPAMTHIVIGLSQWLQTRGLLLLPVFIPVALLWIYAKKRIPAMAYFIDKHLLKLPLIGGILKHSAIARLSRTLAVSFAAGLPLPDALQAVAGATGNQIYTKATHAIRADITTGKTLQSALENSPLFPPLVVQMISVGESSGKLDQMLIKIAQCYEDDVENHIEILTRLLEPCIMVILGLLIGGLVTAMYLPIFKMGSVF